MAITETRWRRSLPLVAVALSIVAVVLAALAFTHRQSSSQSTSASGTYVTRGGPTPSHAPIAVPPLLGKVPPPAAAVELATGQAGGRTWHLYGAIAPVASGPMKGSLSVTPGIPMPIGPGLNTELVFDRSSDAVQGGGGSGPSGDPRQMPTLAVGGIGPATGLDVRMLLGVTTARSVAVRVTFTQGQTPVTVSTVGHPSFPGLRFFVVEVPAKIAAIEALDHTGTPIFQADPGLLPY